MSYFCLGFACLILNVRRRKRTLAEHFASAHGTGRFDPRFLLVAAHAVGEPVGFAKDFAALALPPSMFQVLGSGSEFLAAFEQWRTIRVRRWIAGSVFQCLHCLQEVPQRRTKALLVNGRAACGRILHVSLGLVALRLRLGAVPTLPCPSLIR